MRIFTIAAAALAAGAVSFGALTIAKTQTASAQSTLGISSKIPASESATLGKWISVCETGEPLDGLQTANLDQWNEGACHLRYVDIIETGGKSGNSSGLGMIAAFVAPDRDSIRVEFGISPGISFDAGGFHLLRNGFPVWKLDNYDCLAGGVCTFSGPAAEALVTAFSDTNATNLEMKLDFTDSTGKRHIRQWPMMPFSKAFADFATKQNAPVM
ncbi:MAG: hypothetical protein NXI27_25890 [Alphaproteobacteria bacterium]|nr:hypothetical protein [Alphaproteobacteria bacterium]